MEATTEEPAVQTKTLSDIIPSDITLEIYPATGI